MDTFERELEQLINKFSKEDDSNTPDFLLAEYLNNCLINYGIIVSRRDEWYSNKPETDEEIDL